tara:strand:- start:454 stop:696 length:243 start_codon:yes stop_codon:yes gene_type:complete
MYKKHPPLEKSYNRTLSTIESCQTKEQLEGAINMVKNFKTLYRKVGYPKALSYNLDNCLKQKYMLLESLNKPTKNNAYGI